MRLGLLFAALVVVLDQLSKWAVTELLLNTRRILHVTPFFNLVLTWNKGVSFGLLAQDSPLNAWALSLFALVVVVVLGQWLRKAERPWLRAALGLVIGGALGNVIDRIRIGAVTDFLDVHWLGLHWPAFNVADSAITAGVVMLFIDALFAPRDSNKQ